MIWLIFYDGAFTRKKQCSFSQRTIDFADISPLTPPLIQDAIHLYKSICSMGNWRKVIVSSSYYPKSQAGIPQHAVHTIPREEWNLWQHIMENTGSTSPPGFSDYPTSSAEISNVDPRFMSPYVSVRYSDWNNWILVKGTAARSNGWEQTQNLSQILVSSPYYFGPHYSWGDSYIYDRVNGNVSSGGSKVWRKVAHTHHLTMVVEQLLQYSS